MKEKETLCRAAAAYHKLGINCAQCILAAFHEETGLTEAQSMALGTGLGGGMRCGSICGAISGGILVLGLLHPALPADGAAGKKAATVRTQEFIHRFTERFGYKNCPELLANHDLHGTEMAEQLGVIDHCGILIVSAVEMLCDYLDELKED